MDNASKALIMAGAILISVAIVGIGIYIFSTANALTDDAVGQIDSLAVSAVNSRIETYVGQNVRGSQVKQLYREISTMNRNGAMPEQVTMVDPSGLPDAGRYRVSVHYDENTGYIDQITYSGESAS